MNSFALIGAAGYVAPRHMRAIRDTGNKLVAAFDTNDSVGVIDNFFPDADFFTEFERFDRHIDLIRRRGEPADFVSICSPNYLHDAHIRFALRSAANAICEKPLVLNPWNIDGLEEMEKETGKRVNTILQLRLHPAIVALRDRVQSESSKVVHDVDLTYIASRGRWYSISWKGDERKSGGVATNIGVHFFDMLYFVFGPLKSSVLHFSNDSTSAGYLEYERARVRWLISTKARHLPTEAIKQNLKTFRSISVDGEEIEFSGGFADLHTLSYREILTGRGFGIEENRCAIETVSALRTMVPLGLTGEYHPQLKRIETL